MKKNTIKLILTILFFLIEISLPTCIVVTYYFINDAYVSYQIKKYDIDNDGVWSKEEQTDDYQYWANAYYADGARNVFLIYFSVSSICLGIIFKIIFFFGNKVEKSIVGKINSKTP